MGSYSMWNDGRVASLVTFTSRENEVMQLLMQGKSNEQIARRLSISRRTVRFHLCNVYLKLAVENRAHAVAKAIQMGLIGGASRPPNRQLAGSLAW